MAAWAACSALRAGRRRQEAGADTPEQSAQRVPPYASEDCLYLDVWAPAAAGDSKRPVLLWIYGGGLMSGAKDAPGQSGRPYAQRGIVFVSCNYRVGALGFLVPRGGDANCGLWDQVMALRWIRDEVAAFGGDPGKVTIVGESAGADSVMWLCCSPVANRLFQRAVLLSPGSFTVTGEQAAELADEFAAVAGVRSASLADLQALSVESVLAAQEGGRFRIWPTTSPGWRELTVGQRLHKLEPMPDPTPAGLFRFPEGHEPVGWPLPVAVVDGDLLMEAPLDALAHGVASHLDVIIGANRDEDAFDMEEGGGYGWKMLDWDMAGLPAHVRTALRTDLVRSLAWEIAGAPAAKAWTPEALQACIERLLLAYEDERCDDLRGLGPAGLADSPAQWLQDATATDFAFLAVGQLAAERLARPGGARRVFRYQFEGFEGRGATHAAELELVLGEDDGLKRGAVEARQDWLDSIASFARCGDPNTPRTTGAWRPHSDADRPVALWDGILGWRDGGGDLVLRRRGLMATARLWEELWQLEPIPLPDRAGPGWRQLLGPLLPSRLW